jgi:hypothetical protein
VETLQVVDEKGFQGTPGAVVPMIANKAQEKHWEMCLDCWENQRPIRFVILKARQEGFSTQIQGIEFTIVTYFANIYAYVVADTQPMAELIFDRTRRFWDTMDENERRPCRGGQPTKDRIDYASPWYSKLLVQHARNFQLARGLTPRFGHFSEYAYWPGDPSRVRLSFLNAMPKSHEQWFTGVWIESTANGHNHFRQFWKDAENGKNGFTPVFFDWQSFPHYSLPLYKGQKLEKSKEVQERQKRFGLSEEQVKWMLQTIHQDCDGKLQNFDQEYPSSAELAFVSTGHPWFSPERLANMRAVAAKIQPIFKGRIEIDTRYHRDIVYQLVEDPFGPLTIWEHPVAGCSYVMALDPGAGVKADFSVGPIWKLPQTFLPNDVSSVNSTSAASSFYEAVAEYRSNHEPPEVVVIHMWALGHYYRWPLWGIENTGMGKSAVVVAAHGGMSEYPAFKRYPRLYKKIDEDKDKLVPTETVGYNTNSATKRRLLSHLRNVVNDGSVKLHSLPTISEMEGFSWVPVDGKLNRGDWEQSYRDPDTEKFHDDTIMGHGICYQMALVTIDEQLIPGARSCDR